MAPLTQVQKDINALNVKIARLEERIEPKSGAHGLRNTILSVVGSATLLWVGWVSYMVASMSGKLENGGSKALVASLQNPQSPALLKANLQTVVASIETARAQGTKANPDKTIPLSLAVNHVLQDKNPPSEAWQAASQLINYRSGVETPSALPTCDVRGKLDDSTLKAEQSPQDSLRLDVYYQNCAVVIDNPAMAEYYAAFTADYRREHNIPVENVYVNYHMHNVHIIYRGGPIEAAGMILDRCTFEFQLDSSPAPRGRIMVERLLAAEHIDSVTIPDLKTASSPA